VKRTWHRKLPNSRSRQNPHDLQCAPETSRSVAPLAPSYHHSSSRPPRVAKVSRPRDSPVATPREAAAAPCSLCERQMQSCNQFLRHWRPLQQPVWVAAIVEHDARAIQQPRARDGAEVEKDPSDGTAPSEPPDLPQHAQLVDDVAAVGFRGHR
jgi:hypothetical protein